MNLFFLRKIEIKFRLKEILRWWLKALCICYWIYMVNTIKYKKHKINKQKLLNKFVNKLIGKFIKNPLIKPKTIKKI